MLDAQRKSAFFQRPPSERALREDPFAYVDYDHSTQRALADLLEDLADSLPDCVNRAAAALAAGRLRDAPREHARMEEEALFPAIERCCPDSVMAQAVAAARRDHDEAAGDAIELAEALDALAETGIAANPESLGFMLRAYFEGLRRHLRWVEAAITTPARARMDEAATAHLAERLAAALSREDGLGCGPAGLRVIHGARRADLAGDRAPSRRTL